MKNNPQLLMKASLTKIEVKGNLKDGKPNKEGNYFVQVFVDDIKPTDSTDSKFISSVLTWEWNDHEIWYTPSSKVNIKVFRKSTLKASLFKHMVGQFEGKVVDLLENDTNIELMNKEGDLISAKLKINLTHPTESKAEFANNARLLMEQVDANVSHLSKNNTVMNTTSSLWQALQFAKSIMDKVSTVHPILQASWTVLSHVIEAVQATDIQDGSIQELAKSLEEMLGAANAFPDLANIADMPNVIEQIGHQSLQIASLIDEYTRLSFTARAARIQIPGDLKTQIEAAKILCADLVSKFDRRLVMSVKHSVDMIKDDQLAGKICRWLSPPDSSRNFNEALEKHGENTCSWIFEDEQFCKWMEVPGFLWIKGKAGSGKSVLSASIVDKISGSSLSAGIACFFFDGRDSQSELQTHDKLIRSFIAQLSDQCCVGGIPTTLVNLYNCCKGEMELRQPSNHQLEGTLQDIFKQLTHVKIVIDALDECTNREKTLCWIQNLIKQDLYKIHILLTSRPLHDIQRVIGELCSVDIGKAPKNQDISTFVEHQFKAGGHFEIWDKNIQKDIKSQLLKHADGLFRWISLQLDALRTCLSLNDIKSQLASLPQGLDESYERILNTIDRQYMGQTKVFLQWLAFSKRPMSIAEIAETVTVDLGDAVNGPVYRPENRYLDPQGVLLRCSSLVTEFQGSIKLSHLSVKEYLLSDYVQEMFHISEKTSHSTIAQISVAYLLQFNTLLVAPQEDVKVFALAQYAATHWSDHASPKNLNLTEVALIMRLLNDKEAVFENWRRFSEIKMKPWESISSSMPSPLYYMALKGFYQVVACLVKENAQVNAQGGEYGNALQAALAGGHADIAKLLIKQGADVHAQGGYYGNALQAASAQGHYDIAKLLLEQGVDVNLQGGYYRNALLAASVGGHADIAKLLLEQRADVNAQSGYYGHALQAALVGGHAAHADIAELLLEQGADVNAQGGYYGNALQAASVGGHADIAKLLLEQGADVNVRGGNYGHALQAASAKGHIDIAKLLIEQGADVNAQGGDYGNALQAVSAEGHTDIAKLLLEWGADVNVQGGGYGNALLAVSAGGHADIAELLLGQGADVNAQGGDYGNALQAASARGYADIAKLLLEQGADVNAQGGDYGNALQAASGRGHAEIAKLLLEQGADVNAQGGNYRYALQAVSAEGHADIGVLLSEQGSNVNGWGGHCVNALQAALAEGHADIAKLLLEWGAEVNVQGGDGGNVLQAVSAEGHADIDILLSDDGSDVNVQGEHCVNALQAASAEGHADIAKLLLEWGAEVNAQGGNYGNALQAASTEGHIDIAKLLIEQGADVNAQGGAYINALQAASGRGHAEIAKLLLKQGANVNAQGGHYGNAPQAASTEGHIDIAKVLLEHGADVNSQGGDYGIALQSVSAEGHADIAKPLPG